MIHYGKCCVCEQDGEWPTAEQRSTWFDYHWEQTGHEDEFTIDRPHVHILGLREARYPSTCVTCGKHTQPGAMIAPHGYGWDCHRCAAHRAKETTE